MKRNMPFADDWASINNIDLLKRREYGAVEHYVQRHLHVTSAYVDCLEREAVLKGHEGCVNCLEWNSNGQILASGSDDLNVILWDPFQRRQLSVLRTKHVGNMFSVKFLPRHDTLLATAAADKHIFVFDINKHEDPILCCNCHIGRVKRLATAPDSPHIFWSAGEDGNVLQLDIRERHRCSSDSSHVRLLNLCNYLVRCEVKCVAVNPRRTEYLAVGANDPFARIYDRRMIRLTGMSQHRSHDNFDQRLIMDRRGLANPDEALPNDCVKYYCPGHISKNKKKVVDYEPRAITYLAYNEAGTELLVNMGGEHIYLYDLVHAKEPTFLDLPAYKPPETEDCSLGNAKENGITPQHKRRLVPHHIEHFRKNGNDYLENEKYLRAIEEYSKAIALAPDCPVLYLNRATAYMRRVWYGDIYAALRDCHRALYLDPTYVKAHFRLARALHELGCKEDAENCLKELIARFPSFANNHGVKLLASDIQRGNSDNSNNIDGDTHAAANATGSAAQQQLMDDSVELSDKEIAWRAQAKDYMKRFVGHCNTTTDIKEANYFGADEQHIVAGSDDGNFFIWERRSGRIRAVYRADSNIVNCVLPHASVCLLATSGIDHDIKLWSPKDAQYEEREHLITSLDACVDSNQTKMKNDPFDLHSPNTLCRSS